MSALSKRPNLAALTAVSLFTLLFPASAVAAPQRPVWYSLPVAAAAELARPGSSPPGANDWSCRPSLAHPRPVVLVHGLAVNMTSDWNTMSPLLANNGYCVFALTYGIHPGASFPLDQVGALDPVHRLDPGCTLVLPGVGAPFAATR